MKHGPWLSKVSYILDPLLDGDLECYSVGLTMCRRVEDGSAYGCITAFLHREGKPRAESVSFATYAPPDRPELREQLKQALARLRGQPDMLALPPSAEEALLAPAT